MTFPENWQQEIHDRVYRQVRVQIRLRRETEPGFTRTRLEQQLEAAYVDQGNDWLGRGTVQDITMAATIAAYEAELAEWPEDEAE